MLKQTTSGKINFSRKVSIVNPDAARKKWTRRKKLRKYLKKRLPGKIYEVAGAKQNTIELAKKLSSDHTVIVAVGGDGTVADVIQGIIESRREKDVLLGIIPLGSGNAFRKSLRIPKNVKKAAKVLNEGETKEIDLIEVEGKPAGFVSIGATAQVTQKKLEHRIQGLIGHLLAGRILFTLQKKEHEVELFDGINDDGVRFSKKILRLKFLDCVVGKTNYFGYSFKIAPKAMLDDSYLDITFFEIQGLKYLLYFPFIYFGLYQKTQRHYKARKMIIKGEELPIQYNGEFLGVKDRVEVRVLPQALKIISPVKIKQ
ncbi:MAG: diacylglycerol kinase family protein [Candidatus Aminicenantaceae bacterium]